MTDTQRVARIDALTDAQRETFPEWEARWIAHGHRATPLTKGEWVRVEQGVRDCYAFAGLAAPTIIRATSPLAACIAVHVARRVRAAVSRSGVRSGVWSGVRSGVWSGVRSGVASGVRSGVESGVWSGVGSGVRSGVWSGVESGVWSGVESGVASGVQSGYADWLHEPIRQGLLDARDRALYEYHGGNLWCSWHSYASWFRDVGSLALAGDLWERFAADEARSLAGPGWYYADFCAIADLPTSLHIENRGGRWGLHRGDGPAITWADGWELASWRGTPVPMDMASGDGWDIARIMREPNAEVRRCAVERLADSDGWASIIASAGWGQVGATVPDPGNPGQSLSLWHIPSSDRAPDGQVGLYDEPVRLLRCTNGSPERDGTRHEFGLTVPADIDDPIAAAAWGYGLTATEYASTQVRR